MQNVKEYLAGKLNEEQLKAALHTDSSSLILAGAGSGKTRTLTYKIGYLMFGLKINPSNILAVTFTNKAANEMKERLLEISEEFQEIISDDQGQSMSNKSSLQNENKQNIESKEKNDQEDSINDFLDFIEQTKTNTSGNSIKYNEKDFKRIGTFHSIFLKILKEDIDKLEMKYDKNFTIIDSNDSNKVAKDLLKKLNLDEVFKPNEVKGFISNQKNNGYDAKMFQSKTTTDYEQNMGKVYVEYQKELEKSNMLDFDDLLLLPYLLFRKRPDILEKWKKKFLYIMVDEAQDTNWIQFELMMMLSGKDGNITLIGDDYQSIYGWRGALMENFLNVKKYWPDIQMFKLQINYRSRPYIVNAGNSIIKNNLKQYNKDVHSHREEDGKITVFCHNSDIDEAANIIDLIMKMKDKGKIEKLGDVSILYRTNAQSSTFEQILVQEKIPYKIWGAYKFFEREEVKDILAYIKYLANSGDSVSLKRIINKPTRGIGKDSLLKLEDYATINGLTLHEVLENIESIPVEINSKAKNGILEFKRIIHEITDNWDKYGPADTISKIIQSIKYKSHLEEKKTHGSSKVAERYENIGQLINMASSYIQKGHESIKQFIEEITLMTDVVNDENASADVIKLMTIHSSKGLEFPYVFIAGVEENMFPLTNAVMEAHLLEEERRLMYVGVTRAKDYLFLSYANSRMTRGQFRNNPPSRFIGEIPEELTKHYDLGSGRSKNSRMESHSDQNNMMYYYDDTSRPEININEGDNVNHKLFGDGYVLEIRDHLAVVRFNDPKIGVRKMEARFLKTI
ncbi:MAG: UvrD-helicase domain-containing protein [Candidatus Absconditabacterales bacterium]|nr:UvrD-helicase domain-containing protein [Candidatus Absconditabacterales bacterium]